MTGLNSILLVVLAAIVIATVVSQSTIDEYDNEPSSEIEERIAKLEQEQKEEIEKLKHKVALILDRLNDQESFAQCLGTCRLGKSP